MKTNYNALRTLSVALLFSFTSWSQTIITQWDFNGDSNVTIPGGIAAPTPAIGT